MLAGDWEVGGATDGDEITAAVTFTAAVGGSALLAFAQRLCEHAARYAQKQAESPSHCRGGCASCRCSCGPACAARYFDLKQALLQTVAYALHLLVTLACVSFNVWIFLGCCGGVLAGELIGSSCKKRLQRLDLAAGGAYEMISVHDQEDEDSTATYDTRSTIHRPTEPGTQ